MKHYVDVLMGSLKVLTYPLQKLMQKLCIRWSKQKQNHIKQSHVDAVETYLNIHKLKGHTIHGFFISYYWMTCLWVAHTIKWCTLFFFLIPRLFPPIGGKKKEFWPVNSSCHWSTDSTQELILRTKVICHNLQVSGPWQNFTGNWTPSVLIYPHITPFWEALVLFFRKQ